MMADDISPVPRETDDRSRSESQTSQPERSRPRYGEYASPQDQASAIATSMPPVSSVLRPNPPVAPAPDPATRLGGHPADPVSPADPVPPTGSGNPATSHTPTASRRWDLVLSIGLLVYGFLNVISGLFQYIDLGAYLDEFYRTLGIGDYAGTSSDRPIGIAIAASNVVSFALAAWFTSRRLRTGKVAFWIPLVAGIVAATVSSALLLILLANDPTMTSYFAGLLRK